MCMLIVNGSDSLELHRLSKIYYTNFRTKFYALGATTKQNMFARSLILWGLVLSSIFGLSVTDNVENIVKYITEGPAKGSGYQWLGNVTDTFGNRILGSLALENAINYVVGGLQKWGFDGVHTETVQNLPHWVRGAEIATLTKPRKYSMAVLGLGSTVPTPDNGITAEAIVVR